MCEGLAVACATGNEKTVEFLMSWVTDDGEAVDPRRKPRLPPFREPIVAACISGNARIVRILLDWEGPPGVRVDETVESDKALRFACLGGHADVVSMLLSQGNVDPFSPRPSGNDEFVSWESDPPEALTGAAVGGHDDIVRMLLERTPCSAPQVDRALEWACYSGLESTARLLIETGGAEPSRCKRISVRGLAEQHRFDVLRLLIVEHGLDDDRSDVIINLCSVDTEEARRLLSELTN